MTHFSRRSFALGLLSFCLLAGTTALPVRAASTFNSGSTGADGAFAPTANVTLQVPDSGVFNFTTVTIPSGVTVKFTRNAANTPVTILASGDVTISGTVDVSGVAGGNTLNITNGNSLDGTSRTTGGPGGPGGFDGGGGGSTVGPYNGTAGDGPGGGGGAGTINQSFGGGGGGGYASAGTASGAGSSPGVAGVAYGSTLLTPLIGGSGGGGGGASSSAGAGGSGGGGGGAILIASSGSINFSGGQITAGGGFGGSSGYGPGGGGSAGAIRLVSTNVTGRVVVELEGGGRGANNGNLGYSGGGGMGYARIEAYNFNGVTLNPVNSIGVLTTGSPGLTMLVNPPQLQIVSVAGTNAPASPLGSFHGPPDIIVKNTVANPVNVAIAAHNIPLATVVTLSLIPLNGTETSIPSNALAGTNASSTTMASVSLPDGKCVLYASATVDLTGKPIAMRMKMDGEFVDKILVAAVYGGPSQLTYILHSGRKIVIGKLLLGVQNAQAGRN